MLMSSYGTLTVPKIFSKKSVSVGPTTGPSYSLASDLESILGRHPHTMSLADGFIVLFNFSITLSESFSLSFVNPQA